MARSIARVAALIAAVVAVPVVGFGAAAFVEGWRLSAYAGALSITGVVALCLGPMSAFGAYQTRRDAFYLQAQALQGAPADERARLHLRDVARSHVFAVVMVAAGLALLAAGGAVSLIAR